MADVIDCNILFHCIKVHFARVFRRGKVLALFVTSWPMLVIATFISLHKVHFARVSRHEKVLALFVTSWPMFFIATFLSLHNVHLLEFPGMRRFWHYICYLMADVFHCNVYFIA